MWQREPWPTTAAEFPAQGAIGVLGLRASTLLQYQHNAIDKVLEVTGAHGVRKVATVNADRNPALKLVSNTFRTTNEDGTSAANIRDTVRAPLTFRARIQNVS